MNKTELTNSVAATSGLSRKDTALTVNALLYVITATLQQEKSVTIPGFGSFTVKERPARMGHNPRTGAALKIAAKKVVKFNAGSNLKIEARIGKKSSKTKK